MDTKIKSTIKFYDKNAENLLHYYNNANMSHIHNLILKYINKNSKILDIGFGSGRDIKFLLQKKYKVWGADPSKKFVYLAKEKFKKNRNRFFKTSLPYLKLPKKLEKYFDLITLIAVWMHIPKKYYDISIKNIQKYLSKDGIVILSYSITPRDEKERFFENIDEKYLRKIFEKYGFIKLEEIINKDASPKQREILWKTVIYKKIK